MKYYLAGPMTGIPQFNFPLFASVTKLLRERGYDIVSPAETDSPAVQAAAVASPDGAYDEKGQVAGETWGDMLAKDVKLIADEVDGIVLLPGWATSKGARLEAFVAVTTGKRLMIFDQDLLCRCTPAHIMHDINRGILK